MLIASEIGKDQVQILRQNAAIMIGKFVAMERRPFTLSVHYLDRNRAKHLASLKEYRQRHTASLPLVDMPDTTDTSFYQEARQIRVNAIPFITVSYEMRYHNELQNGQARCAVFL